MPSALRTIFLEEADRRLSEVEAILARDIPAAWSPPFATLERHAHTLKGTAGSLGFTEVERIAAEIQERLVREKRDGREGDPAEITRRFEAIRAEVERLRAQE